MNLFVHQGFIDERERLNLSEKEIVPVNAAKINELILRSFLIIQIFQT